MTDDGLEEPTWKMVTVLLNPPSDLPYKRLKTKDRACAPPEGSPPAPLPPKAPPTPKDPQAGSQGHGPRQLPWPDPSPFALTARRARQPGLPGFWGSHGGSTDAGEMR